MKKAGGFTLIEMIVVIVVLGILAITAVPKFLDVQSEARIATLQGVGGALQSSNGIVYGQAAIQGKEKSVDPEVIETHEGPIDIMKGNIYTKRSNILMAMDTDMNMYNVSGYPAAVNGATNQDNLAVVFMYDHQIAGDDGEEIFPFSKFKDNGCYMVAYNDTTVERNGQFSYRLKTDTETSNC